MGILPLQTFKGINVVSVVSEAFLILSVLIDSIPEIFTFSIHMRCTMALKFCFTIVSPSVISGKDEQGHFESAWNTNFHYHAGRIVFI